MNANDVARKYIVFIHFHYSVEDVLTPSVLLMCSFYPSATTQIENTFKTKY